VNLQKIPVDLTAHCTRAAKTPRAYLLFFITTGTMKVHRRPQRFFVWASREAHADAPHFLRWNARKDSLLASCESTFWKKIA
jgi:hypothetical protein